MTVNGQNKRSRSSTRLPSISCPPIYDYPISTIVLVVVQHEEDPDADLHHEEITIHGIWAELEGIDRDCRGESTWVRFPVGYPEKVKNVRPTLHKNSQARPVGSLRVPTYWFITCSMIKSKSSSGSIINEKSCAGRSRMVHCFVVMPFVGDGSRTKLISPAGPMRANAITPP